MFRTSIASQLFRHSLLTSFSRNFSSTSGKLSLRCSCKQLVTLGPSSNSVDMIHKLVDEGADAFRLNFSHGTHEEKTKLVNMIRKVESERNKPFAIVGDLQGPKLRIGRFSSGKIKLSPGQRFRFDMSDAPGDDTRVCLPHPEIINSLNNGDILLLDDGRLKMKVTQCFPESIECEVVIGGMLSDKKGVNTPTIVLPISPLTPKDRVDVEHAMTLGVDWIALSFVQKTEDIEELQAIVQGRAKIMAKLEKPQAIDDMEGIIRVSDGIMVARGDLGVEMNPEEVPVVQKMVVRRCHQLGKPVVIATQMLESMITAPTPTRAEASDVATAVYDGVDAIMLSAESASGQWPVEAVAMQQKIIRSVEGSAAYRSKRMAEYKYSTLIASDANLKNTDAFMKAARDVAQAINATAIISFTATGATIFREAAARPLVPIIAATPHIQTARALQLVWGVEPIVIPPEDEKSPVAFRNMMTNACARAVELNMISKEDNVVVTAGLPFGVDSGLTNYLRAMTGEGPTHPLTEDYYSTF